MLPSGIRLKTDLLLQKYFMRMVMLAVPVCRALQINTGIVAWSWVPKDTSFQELKL